MTTTKSKIVQPDLPPLPRVGPICYASRQDVLQYTEPPAVGRHIPGVFDVSLWTTDQMRAYAAAAVLAEQKKAERLRAKLQEIGDFAASCATGPGLREALAMIEQMVAAPGEQQP